MPTMTDASSPLSASLHTPVLLLAMPQVMDPFFQRSVILLLHHDDEGSFGFIVNRPTEILITEVLSGMEIDWTGPDDATAYFGGPVQPEVGTVLFAGREEAGNEVAPGLRVSRHVQDLASLAPAPPERFRLILGYAGWSSGQLVDEIQRNDWLTAPVDDALIFAGEPAEAWRGALRSVGVDPDTLPAWTSPDGAGGAN